MSNLKSAISELAENFSEGVLQAIRGVSLEELLAESGSAGSTAAAPAAARRGRPPGPAKVKVTSTGRLARRSQEEIDGTIATIVGALKKAPDGLGSEALQTMLGIEKKEITGPLTQALASRILKKTGNKRATKYHLGSGGKMTTKSAKKPAAKTGKAKAKKTAPKKKPAAKAEAAKTE